MRVTTTSLSIGVFYSTVYIYDCSVRGFAENSIKDVHCQQGFSWLPSSVAFFSIHDVGDWSTDVFLDEPVQLAVDAVRAIQVPFSVCGDQGLKIEDGCVLNIIQIPAGNYALVVEQGYLGPPPGDIETGETKMWCRLWFNRTKDNVEAKILIQDAELQPHYPLKLDGLDSKQQY
jgi:hypothetical protein